MRDGRTKHPLYKVYYDMRGRCFRSSYRNFHRWGGRGIIVCERWMLPNGEGFWNFVSDMGEKPTSSHTLDRIDNDKNYSPDNCRWATWHEQQSNQSGNKGIIGISHSSSKNCWRATLTVSGERVLDVCSKDLNRVLAARKEAELEYGI